MNYPTLHDKQKQIVRSRARFKVIRAGRRSGKTTLEIEDMCFTAISKKDTNVFYIAPTQKQARTIVWEALKARLAGVGEANESRLEMRVPTVDGGYSMIYVAGWESRENFRGMKAHLIVFDELDTMIDFFLGWQEVFRPALADTQGRAVFIGTPKKENPNLRRLEKVAETDSDYHCFHFTTYDNPHTPAGEIDNIKSKTDYDTFKQEYMAEYVDNTGALFKYDALLDVFTNHVTKDGNKYLIVDISDGGDDSCVFSYWDGLEEYKRDKYTNMNTEGVIDLIREATATERIPMSHVAADGIGIGAGVVSSSQLTGIVNFKSSYAAIKTDASIVQLPNVHYLKDAPLVTDYRNLRSQCIFTLAEYVNNHKIASRVSGQLKESIIEELALYQDESPGDGKRHATSKDKLKEVIGHSPDDSDTWIMRMYFEIRGKVMKQDDPKRQEIIQKQIQNMMRVGNAMRNESTR